MDRPRFSIVIPTRERANTLRHTLQTCLDQDFDDYEVIVCDNHSSPATREVVEAAASPRVRYIRAERPLGMSANWELAYTQARGEYITYLGDDDGLFPYTLKELDRLFRTNSNRALRWQRAVYTWPCLLVKDEANLLRIPMSRALKEVDSLEQIRRVIRFEIGADELPMIYSGAVHRSVLEELKERTGRVFLNWCPDVYSGIAIAHVAGTYLSSTAPLSMAGLSGNSNGVAVLAREPNNRIAEEFFRLSRADGYPPHPRVPDVSVWPVTTADSFMYAKDALFPDDDTCVMDRRQMSRQTLYAVTATEPEARARIRSLVRESLADDPELIAWFDREALDPPPAKPRVFENVASGFSGDTLTLQAERFGISNIAEAVRFTTDLLGCRHKPLQFDVFSREELLQKIRQSDHLRDVALAERQQAVDIAEASENAYKAALKHVRHLEDHTRRTEQLYHDALSEGALRNVPRRVLNLFLAKFRGRTRSQA